LIAVAIMALSGDDVRLVFWLAVPPAFLAVLLLWTLVPDAPAASWREPIGIGPDDGAPAGAGLGLAGMGRPFWGAIALAALFTLGRYSEAFLVLRAQERGLPLALAPLVLVAMNVVYSLAAYPAGRWSDRLGRRGLLLMAALVMAAADALLAAAEDLTLVAAGVMLWGLHMAFSQGVLTALVADTAAPHRRGAAFGVFHLTGGIALLAASAGSGLLWTAYGPPAAFLAGLAVALMSALALVSGAGRARPEAG
jgi:MFS family permease